MKKLTFLKEGDTISFVAPSFGCAEDPYKTRLEVAIENFEELGYKLDLGKNIFLANSVLRSNSARKCAQEFMEAYLSKESKAVISVGGGEMMMEILPFVDFNKLKKAPPKIFMGFSDNTNLTFPLTTICEVPTIYGPCVPGFALKPYEYDILDSLNLLKGQDRFEGYKYWQRYGKKTEDPLGVLNITEPKVIKTFPNKDFEIKGRLLGGCLDILVYLCGTKYDHVKEYIEKYKDDGIIWYLEACDLSPLDLERALFSLREAGWFKYCKGFLMGRPLCFRKRVMGITHYRAIKENLKCLNVPIAMDIDLGHFKPSMPMINGEICEVKIKDNNIFMYYPELNKNN